MPSHDWKRERYQAWLAAGRPTKSWTSFGALGTKTTSGHQRRAATPATSVTATPESPTEGTSNLADLPEGRVSQWSKEDLAIFASAGLALVMGLTLLASSKAHLPELATTAQEATAIAGPLSRIVVRRIKVPAAMRGDAADGLALASAVSAYIIRVYASLSERAREERERRSSAVYNPSAAPAPPNGGPASNGAAASFFPPANRMPGSNAA